MHIEKNNHKYEKKKKLKTKNSVNRHNKLYQQ